MASSRGAKKYAWNLGVKIYLDLDKLKLICRKKDVTQNNVFDKIIYLKRDRC